MKTNRICNSTFLSISQEGNVWTHQCTEIICFNLFSIWYTSHSWVIWEFLCFTGAVVLAWSLYSILYCNLCIVRSARQGSKGRRGEIIFYQTRDRMFVVMLYEICSLTHSTSPVLVLWYFAVHCCISLHETFALLLANSWLMLLS